MIELIGWAGNIIFALSAIPQAYMCYRTGNGKGLSGGLLWMWFIGESLAMTYGYIKDLPLPLMTNYMFNFLCLCVILRYKYFERN